MTNETRNVEDNSVTDTATLPTEPNRGVPVYLKHEDGSYEGKLLLSFSSGVKATVLLTGKTEAAVRAHATAVLQEVAVPPETVGSYTYFAVDSYDSHK